MSGHFEDFWLYNALMLLIYLNGYDITGTWTFTWGIEMCANKTVEGGLDMHSIRCDNMLLDLHYM